MRLPLTTMSRPAPTIRLRLTLVYGVVFLLTGAALLSIGYVLVRHNLASRGDFGAMVKRFGFIPPPRPLLGAPFKFRFGPGSAAFRLAAAYRAELRDSTLHRLLLEYIGALAAMTVVSVGAGWIMAGRVLRPLREITAAARRVSSENLTERISLRGPADELRELADTFDGMLGRLESAFASQRHFVANASHELRTPLAIMRTEVDVALADPRASSAELRQMGEAIRETVDRCERLIEGLLVLARSEAASGVHVPVDLAELAAEVVTDLEARARDAGGSIACALAAARVRGDVRLLERMLANLLENSIRHGDGEARVSTITESGGWVRLEVVNGGGVIDPEALGRLVEPFVRLERGGPGFGLGLSIVRSIVEAHGGRLELDAPGAGGLRVSVLLPGEVGGPPLRRPDSALATMAPTLRPKD